MKILSVIAGVNDGCSYYRMIVPTTFIRDASIQIDHYICNINKFSSSPLRLKNKGLQHLNGHAWDQLKWLNRLPLLYKKQNYDYLWINRSVLNFKNIIDSSAKNVIYDFDDAVWLGDAAHCFAAYCKKAGLVMAGNSFLYEEAKKYTKKVELIPTSVNTSRYLNLRLKKNTFNVGWIGSSSGYHYLLRIEKQLCIFFSRHKDARLTIISDKFPHSLTTLQPYIDFFLWSRDRDVEFINTFSVGIMPITDTIWDWGKCSFKMLQYMACEVPIIVSNIGMNKEVGSMMSSAGAFGTMINDDVEWAEVLANYHTKHSEELERYGANGRKVIVSNFASDIISGKIERCFKKYL